MQNIKSKYKIPFKPWQILLALILAIALHSFNPPLKEMLAYNPKKIKKIKFDQSYTYVIRGFENISKHIFFKKPKTPLDKKIIMLGACQISSLHWYYWPGGFDPSGRSSLPYNLDKELKKNPETSNVYVYNFGMEGTGYVEALYFLLTALEQPNLKLIIYSIGQEAENHIPNYNKARYSSYIKFLPKLSKLLQYYHERYPEIEELKKYYQYVKNNSWTIAGFKQMKAQNNSWEMELPAKAKNLSLKERFSNIQSFLKYNSYARKMDFNTKWIGSSLKTFFDDSKEWLQIEKNNSSTTELSKKKNSSLKPVQWYIKNFKPRKYNYKARKFAKYRKKDRLVIRLMAKLLAKKNIKLWIQNPADLAVRMNDIVAKRWWEPLKKSVADLKNVKTIDMSSMPIENGRDTGGRVAPTYYGTLKTLKAFMPYIKEWNKND